MKLIALTVLASAAAYAQPTLPAPVIRERARAALLAAFTADAATAPLHWIYDVNQLAGLVGNGSPLFYSPWSCPFYTYPAGSQSTYGQQMAIYLSVGAATGGLDPTAIEKQYYLTYTTQGQSWYHDGSTREFLANEAAGKHWPNCGGDDSQADALAHMLFPTTMFVMADEASRMQAVDDVIRVTQNTDDAVAFALAGSRVLYNVLALGMNGTAAIAAAAAEMQNPQRTHPMAEDADLAAGMLAALQAVGSMPILNYTLQVGQACEYPHNLFSGSYAIASMPWLNPAADLVNVTGQNIMAGGDQASRNAFVGSVFGAAMGNATLIPAAWQANTAAWATYTTQVNAFVQAIK